MKKRSLAPRGELVTEKPDEREARQVHTDHEGGVQRGVDAAQAEQAPLRRAAPAARVLDRIVGYDVASRARLVEARLRSPAGRVQSVALRLIVDKGARIRRFVPEEYWNIGAQVVGDRRRNLSPRLAQENGKKLG